MILLDQPISTIIEKYSARPNSLRIIALAIGKYRVGQRVKYRYLPYLRINRKIYQVVWFLCCRFLCQQPRMDVIKRRTRLTTGNSRVLVVREVGFGSPLLNRILHARGVTRRRKVQERNFS